MSRLDSVRGAARIGGALLAASLFLHCAHVEPPPGGPLDTQPPFVVAVYPAPGAHDVARDAAVTLKFSEWIDRGTGRGQVLLSPPLTGTLKVEVSGNRLLVRIPKAVGGLRPNTAYRLSVLGTVKDLHGNAMGPAFSLAFTTGKSFDSGAVSGRIDAPDRRGPALVALYRLTDRDSNSVLPRLLTQTNFRPDSLPSVGQELPAFLLSADSMGNFAFDSVAQGRYEMLAFEDVNGNLSPDFGFEPVAVGSADLRLTPRAPPQFLHLADLDTGFMRVSNVRFVSDSLDSLGKDSVWGALRVKFTLPLRLDSATDPGRYHLIALAESASKAQRIPIMASGWDALSQEWVMETPPLRRNAHYRLDVRGLSDTLLRATREFTASASPDSEPWTLTFLDPPDASGLPEPTAGALLPAAVYPVRSSRILNPVHWGILKKRLDARVDTVAFTPEISRTGPVEFLLPLTTPVHGGQTLQLRLKPVKPDSIFRLLASAPVLDSTKLGSLRFRVPKLWRGWTFLVQALPPLSGERAVRAVTSDVEVAPLATGRYRLAAFLDKDGDGAWSPGSLHPWTPQEPYSVLLNAFEVSSEDSVTDVSANLSAAAGIPDTTSSPRAH